MKEEKSRRKVAILDNCEIDTLYRLKEENIPVELALESYDYILIPGWVWTEVCDSEDRKEYVKDLIRKRLPVKILLEKRYIELVKEDLVLLKGFHIAIRRYGHINGYFQKNILKGKEAVEIDYLYEEWIKIIYNDWPIKGEEIKRSDGSIRESKKNAGEISIAFLAYLLKQKNQDLDITIWSHDSDCRLCIEAINEKEQLFISYKNVDTILKKLYEKNIIEIKRINKLIDCVRSERKVIYFIKKKDSSSELRMEVIDNNKIRELLYSSDCEIIW